MNGLKLHSLTHGKNVDLLNNPAAWTVVSGSGATMPLDIWRKVAYAYRALYIRAAYLTKTPFDIVNERTGEVIDNSLTWQNTVKFLPNPQRLISFLELSRGTYGEGYALKDVPSMRGNMVRGLAQVAANKISVDITGTLLEPDIKFERTNKKGEPETYTPETMFYTWVQDVDVEIGPPLSSPLDAALSAMGVLHDINKFANVFVGRGGVKEQLFFVSGNPAKEEVENLNSKIQRLFGRGKKSGGAPIALFNGETMEVLEVGESISEIISDGLTQQMREDVATALGVPFSIINSNGVNRAVSEEDKRTFYEGTIIPEGNDIAYDLNTQVFNAMGYSMRWNWNSIDIFQEDEEDRSGTVINLVNAGMLLGDALETSGIEIPQHRTYEYYNERTPDIQDEPATLRPAAGTAVDINDGEGKSIAEHSHKVGDMLTDLGKWQRKSQKALGKGKAAAVPFESEYIGEAMAAVISDRLSDAQSVEEVEQVFASVDEWTGYA